MLTNIVIAFPNLLTTDNNQILSEENGKKEAKDGVVIGTQTVGKLTTLDEQVKAVTEPGVIFRTPRAVDNVRFPGEIFVKHVCTTTYQP